MEMHKITWRGVAIEITFTPNKFSMADHIELHAAGRSPLPVTETGYRSQFLPAGAVADHGGAVAFVTAWLDDEAKRTGWSGAQLSLF
jgi:hypothetical protein